MVCPTIQALLFSYNGNLIPYDRYLERTYGNYLNFEKNNRGRILSVNFNSGKLDDKMVQCGFFYIVSNMDRSCEEILTAYRKRDEIEKSFRYIKSESDFSETYAQNDNSLKAKVFMGLLVSIIRSKMISKTRDLVRRKSNFSLQKILLALEKIIMEKEGNIYLMKYTFTKEQQEINNLFSVTKEDIADVVQQASKKIMQKFHDSIICEKFRLKIGEQI